VTSNSNRSKLAHVLTCRRRSCVIGVPALPSCSIQYLIGSAHSGRLACRSPNRTSADCLTFRDVLRSKNVSRAVGVQRSWISFGSRRLVVVALRASAPRRRAALHATNGDQQPPRRSSHGQRQRPGPAARRERSATAPASAIAVRRRQRSCSAGTTAPRRSPRRAGRPHTCGRRWRPSPAVAAGTRRCRAAASAPAGTAMQTTTDQVSPKRCCRSRDHRGDRDRGSRGPPSSSDQSAAGAASVPPQREPHTRHAEAEHRQGDRQERPVVPQHHAEDARRRDLEEQHRERRQARWRGGGGAECGVLGLHRGRGSLRRGLRRSARFAPAAARSTRGPCAVTARATARCDGAVQRLGATARSWTFPFTR
jgi:hypothetical protein